MSPDDEDEWSFDVPEPELTVTEPGYVGPILDRYGRVLHHVFEERAPFGFQPREVPRARKNKKTKKRKNGRRAGSRTR